MTRTRTIIIQIVETVTDETKSKEPPPVNTTGGVSENTEAERSIREFGFGNKPQTVDQIHAAQIANAQSEIQFQQRLIAKLESEINELFLGSEGFGGDTLVMCHVRDVQVRIETAKNQIARSEVALVGLGVEVAA